MWIILVCLEETSSSRYHTVSSSTREAECNETTSKESQTEASQTQEVNISFNNYTDSPTYLLCFFLLYLLIQQDLDVLLRAYLISQCIIVFKGVSLSVFNVLLYYHDNF